MGISGISKRRQVISRASTASDGASTAGASSAIQRLIRLRVSSEGSTKRTPALFFDSLIHTISPFSSSRWLSPGT
jgi:hypothetical protein